MSKTYLETFDEGPGGWLGWVSNAEGAKAIETRDGYAISKSPWWIDYNHAPPGAGYLQLPFCLLTNAEGYAPWREFGGVNRFIEGGYPSDWRHANIKLRLRGEMEMRGTQLVLLAQAKVGEMYVNSVLSAQPIEITKDWSEQTLNLDPQESRWTCLGSHEQRKDRYTWGKAEDVLRDLNCDIIFVLFPVDVVPAEKVEGDPHLLKAGEDYQVDESRLPSGEIHLDTVQVDFFEQ